MQNLVFTQLSVPEVRQLFRDELAAFFALHQPQLTTPNPAPDEIGGIDLAASVTGYAPATIYTLASKRLIPHAKRGKRLIFSRQELRDWLTASKRKTQTELLENFQEVKKNDASKSRGR